MGDPRKLKKKYSGPTHPWQKTRINEEVELMKGYGYRRKNEIWKVKSELSRYRHQARKLIGLDSKQAQLETKQLITKLHNLGLVPQNASIDDVLGLGLQDISERRLQTVVVKKKIASSLTQSRQFITHKHVFVNGKVITSPNYLVSTEEESKIKFNPYSSLSDPKHPLRVQQEEKDKKERVLVSDKEKSKEEIEESKEAKEIIEVAEQIGDVM